MAEDEVETAHRLKTYRRLIELRIQEHRGRVVDTPGDNILADFPSALDATRCAVDIQRALKDRNADLPADHRMEYRIGVHLGDVMVEGKRISGNGVNIAARLEGLADPGGICISAAVHEQVRNKLDLEYADMGYQNVKNIPEPVHVYRVQPCLGRADSRWLSKWHKVTLPMIAIALAVGLIMAVIWFSLDWVGPRLTEVASIENMTFPLPDKPSIAVLPFDNMTGDPKDEYIADGLTEDIITVISRIDQMLVIARNSTFAYKNKPIKIKQVSEDFGVQYVLEGSIQKSGDRLRVTAQLIDALTGHHSWAGRYDRKMKDLFDIKDEITKEIVSELHVEISSGESVRLIARETNSLEAWILYYKGIEQWNGPQDSENISKAKKYFNQAVDIDPYFAAAWAMLGWMHIEGRIIGSENPDEADRKFVEYTRKAISIDASSSLAHYLLGRLYLRQGQFAKAIDMGEKAVVLEPNNPYSYFFLARAMHLSDRPEESIKLVEKEMRLNPLYRADRLVWLGQFLHSAGRYEEAASAYKQFFERHKKTGEFTPLWPHLSFTAAYLELGKTDAAYNHFKQALTIRPNFDFLAWAKSQLRYEGEDFDRFKGLFELLRKAYTYSDNWTQYIHKKKPEFIFEYPEDSKHQGIALPNSVLVMSTPSGVSFEAIVDDMPEATLIKDIGEKYYLPLSSSKDDI